MAVTPEIQGTSVVLVGSFNPAIVHPAWLRQLELLPAGELEGAQVAVSIPDLTQFQVQWLQVQVTLNQFQLSTTELDRAPELRDVAIGIFRELRHSPINAIGINGSTHFKLESDEVWHSIGHALAPKEPWIGVMAEPGMRSLTIEDPHQDSPYPGVVHVTVEPSVRVHPGLYVNVNDHFQLDGDIGPEDVLDTSRALEVLDQEWTGCLTRRDRYMEAALKARAHGA